MRLKTVFRLGIKELHSIKADPVLALLIAYAFTMAVYTVGTSAEFEVRNAPVAVVDEDRSILSFRLSDALLEPYFQEPVLIGADEIDPSMDAGRFTFAIEIPPRFQQDVIAGRQPTVQVDVDATAMSLAGNGAAYIQNILLQEVRAALPDLSEPQPANVVVRAKFNPNLRSAWFTAVMQVINNITMLGAILTGAALIREREHGTIEHLLVMPVSAGEIMLAKIWANGLVIIAATAFSLYVMVERVLAVPITGSIPLFLCATALYLYSITALGLLIATLASSMAQFGLIIIPVLVIMNLLSGSTTPLESMPGWLQVILQLSPALHFVSLSQSVLYRGAGLAIIWPQMLVLAIFGLVFVAAAKLRFRQALLKMR
ncbi:ABC transporter permease [Rhodoligotrophos ferricapiens]|uniref:ABC transporter permease n=1 Tax=Rhodoligotrophos ferricapiens TaxID=3069264 RepID=UPI00315D4062